MSNNSFYIPISFIFKILFLNYPLVDFLAIPSRSDANHYNFHYFSNTIEFQMEFFRHKDMWSYLDPELKILNYDCYKKVCTLLILAQLLYAVELKIIMQCLLLVYYSNDWL